VTTISVNNNRRTTEQVYKDITKSYVEQLTMQDSHFQSHITELESQVASLSSYADKLGTDLLAKEREVVNLNLENLKLDDKLSTIERKVQTHEIDKQLAITEARTRFQEEIQAQLDER
jgi:hypothetical protein